MASKHFAVVLVLFLGTFTISSSMDVPNSTYFDILLQASQYLSQTPTSLNGPMMDFLLSDTFEQLTQAMNQANVLQNAALLLSNVTEILTIFSNSNLSQSDTVNLDILVSELTKLGAFLGTFSDGNNGTNINLPGNFDISSIANLQVSRMCMTRSLETFLALGSGQQWALRMLDASAKIPTDLLNLNLDWMGSFDECVAIKSPEYDIDFRGQYCTVRIPVPLPPLLPGVTPKIEIGTCVPDSCSGDDLLSMINFAVRSLSPENTTMINVGSVVCQLNELPYSGKAIAILCMCGVFFLIMSVATIYDITMIQWSSFKKSTPDLLPATNGSEKVIEKMELDGTPENKAKTVIEIGKPKQQEESEREGSIKIISDGGRKYNIQGDWKYTVGEQPVSEVPSYKPGFLGKLLLSFSVYTNGKKLLNTNQSSGTLTAVNGIRFLSMSWIILGHTFGLGGAENVKNIVVYLPSLLKRTSFQAIVNALVAVDSFFAMSGLLMTYLILKEMKRNKEGEGKWSKFWFMFYFHRFWRLTPPYMLILGIYVTLVPYVYNGPQYSQTGFYNDRFCEENWWTNLLYVNNFVRSNQMCMGWSWYLANDMQFYVVSPLMLLPLFFFPVAGVIVVLIFLLGTTILTGVMGKINKWPPHEAGGGEHPAGDMFYDYYMKPYCRIGPFIIGVLTGYILHKTKCHVKLNNYLNLFIWAVATVLACLVLYGLYEPLNGSPMNEDVSALYLATHRTVWGACVCWVIFACATGNGGFVNTFLSWKAFVPLARLTYCSYLLHPILIAVYSNGLRVQQYWTDLQITYLFIAHLVLSYAGAFIVSLAFEAPMLGIEKVIFNRQKMKKS